MKLSCRIVGTVDEGIYLLNEGFDHDGRIYRYRNVYRFSFFITIFVGLVVFIPLLMMYILLLQEYSDGSELYNAIIRYELGYKVILLALIIYAWVVLQKECKPKLKYKFLQPKDYVTVFCTFGVAAYYINLAVAGFKSPARTGPTEAAEGIVSLAALYLQTVFILQAKGYTSKASYKKSCCSIDLVCLLMAVLNFGFWINDSFLGVKFPSSTIPKDSIFGPDYWSFVLHYIFPFVIFYRFDSSFEFLDLYKEFRY